MYESSPSEKSIQQINNNVVVFCLIRKLSLSQEIVLVEHLFEGQSIVIISMLLIMVVTLIVYMQKLNI